MSFFISDAMAQAAGQPQGSGLMGLLPLILIFVAFWFLLIRPQQKKQKEHRAMVAALAKGDEVITQGGIMGKIEHVDDTFVTVNIAEGVSIKVQRHAIGAVLPKGTIKEANQS